MKRLSLILAVAVFSIFMAVFVKPPANAGIGVTALPGSEVSPWMYDFGFGVVGTSSTVIVAIENVPTDCKSCHNDKGQIAAWHHTTEIFEQYNYDCSICHPEFPEFPPLPEPRDCQICHSSQTLTVQSFVFQEGSSTDFDIATSPSLPFDILPGESEDIEIAYSPSAEGYASAVMQIESNDPHNPLVEVSLGGFGVTQEPDWAEVRYTVTDLGTLGEYSDAQKINELGQVVGYSSISGNDHAFLWTPDCRNCHWDLAEPHHLTPPALENDCQYCHIPYPSGPPVLKDCHLCHSHPQDLGTLGGDRSIAWDINNNSQVVGYSSTPSGYLHAFLWTSDGGMQDLGTPLGGEISSAWGINNSGQVVGYSNTYDPVEEEIGPNQAWVLTLDDGIQQLEHLAGEYSEGSSAYSINDLGQVVGSSYTMGDADHAVLWDPDGVVQDLGTLSGGEYHQSTAWDINNNGHVVGWSFATHQYDEHAFLWTPEGGMQDIDTLGSRYSEAWGINNYDQVVGWMHFEMGPNRAFRWTEDRGMVDLNGLTDGDGWIIGRTRDINDSGQIVGIGQTPDGDKHAFLLNPYSSTPVGSSVSVKPSPVSTITFNQVTSAGDTTVVPDPSPPATPGGYQVLGLYYEVSTSASYSGQVTVCFAYDDTNLTPDQEANVKLLHYWQGSWVDETCSLDTEANIVCGCVSELSPFVVAISLNSQPVANAGPDQRLECTSSTGTPVMLDGSASYDPDSDTLTYRWTGSFPEGGGTVTGVNPIVTLPFGTSTITLVVNDGKVDSEPDTVSITVTVRPEGLQPPLAALVPEGNQVPVPDKASKQGRTLPLKLQLFCGSHSLTDQDVLPPSIASLLRIGEALNLEVIDLDSGQANDNGLLFRFSDGNWIYNLSTKELISGTYSVTIEMPDGRSFVSGFVLK